MEKIALHIKRFYYSVLELLHWIRYIGFPIGEKVYLIGTPSHTNLGDSAIVIAEKLFLQRVYGKSIAIKELTVSEYKECHKYYRFFSNGSRVFWHGGGNMGDLWYAEEAFRQMFIKDQINRKPVIFPQTIFYSDTPLGNERKAASINVYNNENITVVARERKSYSIMKELYPKANVLLTPDIVLSTNMGDYGVAVEKRKGVLLVFRSDLEKSMSDLERNNITAYLNENDYTFKTTDMHSEESVTKENRLALVRKKMQEFATAELVITDRLHGMVFAAITETPCVVFANNHHKVEGTYEWIKDLPYVRYVNSSEEAIRIIPEMKGMKNCKYDSTSWLHYFSELEKEIIKYA